MMLNIYWEIVDDNGEKRVFATNENYDENEVGLTNRLLTLYSKRWGIETSYRVKKYTFRAKTTSKNYMIRLFYFLFSILLYDLWVLINILIWLHVYGFVGDTPLLKSKFFSHILLAIDPRGWRYDIGIPNQ